MRNSGLPFSLLVVGALCWPGASNAQDAGVEDHPAVEDGGREDGGREDGGLPDTAHPDAWRPDSVPPADAGEPCDWVTFLGSCDGVYLRYCNNNRLVTVNCSDPSQSRLGGEHATCGLVDCTNLSDCWGYDCVAKEGESCGLGQHDLFCDVELEHGCVQGVCVQSSACDSQSFVPSCQDNNLSLCPTSLLWDIDCSEQNQAPYTCGGEDAGMACVGTEGAPCGSDQHRRCADGYTCTAGRCQGLGVEDAAIPDGARRDATSTNEKPPQPEDCNCQSPLTGLSFLLTVLVFVALGIKRRKITSF